MNRLLALAITILLTSCATTPPSEPCRICDASTAPRHDAPVRLFNDDVPTPCGRPHPGWTEALHIRMAIERQKSGNPTATPMDYQTNKFMAPFPVPAGIERDVRLWKPKR